MPGRVAERFKAPVLKTGRGRELPREFESHPFRHFVFFQSFRHIFGPRFWQSVRVSVSHGRPRAPRSW